jgi:hypothetical protein
LEVGSPTYQDISKLIPYYYQFDLKDTDYENEKKEYYIYMRVEPVSFGKEHKDMLGHCKMLLEQGYVAINPAFDKLITSLRTAVAEENILDKEATSYTEIFEAYRLALKLYWSQAVPY